MVPDKTSGSQTPPKSTRRVGFLADDRDQRQVRGDPPGQAETESIAPVDFISPWPQTGESSSYRSNHASTPSTSIVVDSVPQVYLSPPRTRRMESLQELDDQNISEIDAKIQAAKEAQERAAHTHADVEVSDQSSTEYGSSLPSPASPKQRHEARLRSSKLYAENVDNAYNDDPRRKSEQLTGSKPSYFRISGLGALNLLNHFGSASSSAASSPFTTPSHSRASSPERPGRPKRNHSSHSLTKIFKSKKDRKHSIRRHVSETQERQKYILKICIAMMKYGAPTHRLEALMMAAAQVLEVEAQFLYFPGVMVVSFDDRTTSTADVRVLRVTQGVDLGKMVEVHHIYRWVMYGEVTIGEACNMLDALQGRPNKFRRNFLILVHGLASVTVGPWAFQAQWLDLPIVFCFGLLLGWLRLVWAPKTEMWTNVFEIVAVIITSFLSRAFGSIRTESSLFCFSNLAQSSIALILPGYIVLNAALELQSHSIIAGSIRMVYAFIYSLTIGFGITLGTVIYGLLDSEATTIATCPNPIHKKWYILFMPAYAFCLCILNQAKWKQMPIMILIAATSYVVSFFSGLRFTGNSEISSALAALTFSVLANIYGRTGRYWDRGQDALFAKIAWVFTLGRSKEITDLETQSEKPQRLSSFLGFMSKLWGLVEYREPSSPGKEAVETTKAVGGFFAQLRQFLTTNSEVRQRATHALSSAVMLPAVFVLVPSGLSSQGSLVASLQTSAQVNGNSTASTTLTTQNIIEGRTDSSSTFTVGYSIIQIAIGLTVGIFFGSALVYPFSGQSGNVNRFSNSKSKTKSDSADKEQGKD